MGFSHPTGSASPFAPLIFAAEVATLPRGEDWIYEFSWGGERVRASKEQTGIRLISKDGKDITNRFPRVAAAVAKLRTESVLIDGEILLLDGISDSAVRFLSQISDDLSQARVALLAYDLLWKDGTDLRPLPLLCRRLKLASVVQGTPIILSPLVERGAAVAVTEGTRLGLRGVVAKRSGSAYRPNALANDWVKVSLAAAVIGDFGHAPEFAR